MPNSPEEGYQPSQEEVQKAKEMMTGSSQGRESADREVTEKYREFFLGILQEDPSIAEELVLNNIRGVKILAEKGIKIDSSESAGAQLVGLMENRELDLADWERDATPSTLLKMAEVLIKRGEKPVLTYSELQYLSSNKTSRSMRLWRTAPALQKEVHPDWGWNWEKGLAQYNLESTPETKGLTGEEIQLWLETSGLKISEHSQNRAMHHDNAVGTLHSFELDRAEK